MRLLEIVTTVVLLLGPCHVQARAVFAHFMVTNTANWTSSQWESDISTAQSAHIDAFALNMAVGDPANDIALPMAFAAADSAGFGLFFSFDYAGNGPWDEAMVISLINQYAAHSSYYRYNGNPFVSTFEGSANAADWTNIKAQTGCFFMPDWSSLGAKAAMELGTADGLFSWAAWPWGDWDSNTYVDASYLQYLNKLPYMMPVSPWFYTNLPGYNKNWLWRSDHLWFDRWQQIIALDPLPDFVEIISWNDYGESHYIGPIHEESMAAFDIGQAPYNYVLSMPHDGWRAFLPFVIDTYKSGIATVQQEGLQVWYRLAHASACSSGGTTANTASQLQIEFEPSDVLQDKVFFSALLTAPASVTVRIGSTAVDAQWIRTPEDDVGIYHGSASFTGLTGAVVVTVLRESEVVSVTGEKISDSCPNGIQNYNAWVGSAFSGLKMDLQPKLTVSESVCVNGTAVNNFVGLCEFTCQYGYCPYTACVCEALGAQKTLPNTTGIQGYPIAGEDASYTGLCSFACNYGYCPETACGTVQVPLIIPTVSDFSPPACVAGSGDGGLAGLCSYACNFGYCPINACQCTATGALNVPPASTSGVSGTAALGNDPLKYDGLCNFACSRGYCPDVCAQESSDGSEPGRDVYIGPSLWTNDTRIVSCEPPCVIVLPNYPLPTTTTISWPSVTLPLLEMGGDGVVTSTSTVLQPEPFPLGYLPFFPITIGSSTTDGVILPSQHVMPSMINITLPGTIMPWPVSHYTFTTATSSLTITSAPAATSTMGVATTLPSVTFSSSSHVVQVQPQPTAVIVPTPIPGVTFKPGPTPDPEGCGPESTNPACGQVYCWLFGCDGKCGLFACNGGCGPGFCGDCGVDGCGGDCSSGSCTGGGTATDPEPPTSTCTQINTVSVCTEVISSYTPVGTTTMTTTTTTYCVQSAGCSATPSTTTITKTTTETFNPTTVTEMGSIIAEPAAATLSSIASELSSLQSVWDATRWPSTTSTSTTGHVPTNGPYVGAVQINYYSDTSVGRTEYDLFQYWQGMADSPENCPELQTPDWTQTGAGDYMPNTLSGITAYGGTCTYAGGDWDSSAPADIKMGTLMCDKWKAVDCHRSEGGGTCAQSYQEWYPLVTCAWA